MSPNSPGLIQIPVWSDMTGYSALFQNLTSRLPSMLFNRYSHYITKAPISINNKSSLIRYSDYTQVSYKYYFTRRIDRKSVV